MIKVGIVGATGYMGGEALRILLAHPEVEIAWATSRSPKPIEAYHPNLYGSGIQLIPLDNITACDLVFVALPTLSSIELVPKLLKMGAKVIDLGAAFRLDDQSTWEQVYQQKHANWSLAEQAVYGISEFYREEISQANLIANPGCFSSAAIFALAPLVKNRLVDVSKLLVNGLSGTAGVGAELSRAAHHPEIGNNLVPYNVIDHRHSYEMEQELSKLSADAVSVHFTPTYVPITRGILNICHAFATQDVTRAELLDVYREYYAASPFIKIFDAAEEQNASWQYRAYPWVSAVTGTNYCFIGLDVDESRGRIVVFSVLDSLGKGGAQAGIENMNLMCGVDRSMGLTRMGLHPN